MDNLASHLVLELINWIKKNFKKPKFWFILLVVSAIGLVIFPYID